MIDTTQAQRHTKQWERQHTLKSNFTLPHTAHQNLLSFPWPLPQLLIENKIQLKTIGRIQELPKVTYQRIEDAKEKTAGFNQLTLTIALNYSSQNEIVDAVKGIVRDAKENTLSIEELDYPKLATYLDTKDIPDPDLIIRTSGEYRLSNFLLLQSAYAEIYTSPIYWPDFNQLHFTKAINQFTQRERRFGNIS